MKKLAQGHITDNGETGTCPRPGFKVGALELYGALSTTKEMESSGVYGEETPSILFSILFPYRPLQNTE